VVFRRRPLEGAAATPGGRQDRFPGFDVMGEIDTWDAETAGVVLDRLALPPDLRFFTVEEEATGRALFDHLLDQFTEPRVPVLELVDSRLAEEETDGWHYEDMPEDGEAFRRSFRALDEDAQAAFGRRFAHLDRYDQADLIQSVHDRSGDWHGMPAGHVWSLWTRYACTAFYSHPWAWNEIGFGGPAYPRGYKALGLGKLEPWEVPDQLDTSPDQLVGEVERARRRHAEARSRQLEPEGLPGVGGVIGDDHPGTGRSDEK
jgi:Gluconate 2-dehydrogenase subunit 3